MGCFNYKAKSVYENKWVCGYYYVGERSGKHYIITQPYSYLNPHGQCDIEVYAKSVCQSINIFALSLNHKVDEIYTNDIVEVEFDNGVKLECVVKYEGGSYVLVNNSLPDGYIPIHHLVFKQGSNYFIKGIIIGNISDS